MAISRSEATLGAARLNADRSILLLESDDIATAGGWNLVPAVAAGLRSTALPVPDLVYLVETSTLWECLWLTAIKHGQVIFAEPEAYGRADEDGRWPALPL